ncbi:MAG: copper resistance protein B [Hyphomicrobiales bacterium]
MRVAHAGVLALALLLAVPATARAQQEPTQPGWPQPMHNNSSFYSAIADQNEVRTGSGGAHYRWDGEAWYGNNTNRLWLRSEGNVDLEHSSLDEAEAQALYARPISSYFDVQAGVRYDFDPNPSRAWMTLGVEGLAPLYWHVGAFAFLSDGGHAAGRLEASYDLLLTQRLILQPQIEATFYSKGEPRRGIVPGLSDFDSGVRVRYEIRRQIAPYLAIVDQGGAGYGGRGASGAGGSPDGIRFAAGIRAWY